MNTRRKPLTILASGLAVTALALAGCGGESGDGSAAADELTPVKLQLQWFAQAQFAGYYAALDQGFFEEEGLDVEILEGGADIVPQECPGLRRR